MPARPARAQRGSCIVPAHLSLPTHLHRQSRLPPVRTLLPGAAIGAAAGAAAGLLLGGVIAIVLLALAGALLVVALIAALPDRRQRREPPPSPHPSPPAATPTTTLAVPPPGPDAPPGWYPDPDPPLETPHIRRLWDGDCWTEHRWAPRDG